MADNAEGRAVGRSRARLAPIESPVVREQILLDAKAIDGGLDLLTMFSTPALLANKPHVTRPYEESGWVHACLKPGGTAVSSAVPRVYVGDPRVDKNAEALPDTDPLVRLFRTPTPLATGAQFFEAGFLHRKLDGEEVWFLTDRNGRPLTPTTAGMIDVPAFIFGVRGLNATLLTDPATGFPREWSTSLPGGGQLTAPAESCIHFRDYHPDDPLRGLGDVESLLLDIDLERQADLFQRALLANSGDPGGWIKTKGTALAAPELKALENQANEAFDIKNAGRWRILKGDQEYVPNSVRPKDMQYSELKARIRDKIAGVLGVPPIIIGVYEHATLANFAQAVELFWKGGNGILSYLASVEDVVNARFISRVRHPSGKRLVFRFDTSGISALREDKSALWLLAADISAKRPTISFAQAAKLLGLEVDPKIAPTADIVLVPAGLTTIEATLAASTSEPEGDEAPADGVDPNAPAAVDAAAMPNGAKVQDTALNGAQVTGLLDVARAVSEEIMDRDAGKATLQVAFPTIDEAEAARIMDGVIVQGPKATPQPAPGGDGTPPNEPPKTDAPAEDDPADDAAKAVVRDAAAEEPQETEAQAKARQERRDWWDVKEARLLKTHQAAMRRKYRRFRDAYERAQFRRLRDYAAEGEAGVRSHSKAADDFTPAPNLRDVEALLLDLEEWRTKLSNAFQPAIEAAARDAVTDLSAELGVSLGGVDQRISEMVSRQTIKLAEGHTSTLADQVRTALQEAMKDEQSSGSLQQIVEQLLPDLEGALKQTFSDRTSRASTIAITESGKAMNRARTIGMVEAGVVEHEWVTSKNASVRGTPGGPYEDAKYSHYELDGKTTRIGELFDPTGHPGLREPGDDNGEPGDVINCNCLTRPVVQSRDQENEP